MAKARKFKRKLARKPVRVKSEPILSVSLIRKENVEKIKTLVNKILSGLKLYRSNRFWSNK